MRHYKNSIEKIVKISQRDIPDQCLFLVADVNNKFDENAVMLHDGVSKLGYVAAQMAPIIREIIDDETMKRGQDVVLVVSVQPQTTALQWSSSFNVNMVGVVYERAARKYARLING